jgi:hypothetical protein
MGQKLSRAAKRKKKKKKEEAIEKKEKEEAIEEEAAADLERLKLGPTNLWTGLVTHHRDIFVSHVLPKLNDTDRCFFGKANAKHVDLLEYAGINVLKTPWCINECSSISTLEWAWNNINWGGTFGDGVVVDQARFCQEVAYTNKLELLKWVREEKKCEWNEKTINAAASLGNLEMLKYCFANDCPCDERESCLHAAVNGHLDCLRFLFEKVNPSRKTKEFAAQKAAEYGQLDILKYFFEVEKISDRIKQICVRCSAITGYVDCLKYMVEEAKVPLDDDRDWPVAFARYFKQTECLHYLREKGYPEPTDEEYGVLVQLFERHNIISA